MSDNRTIQLAEIPIGGQGGVSWNRLHEEREEICEALLKESTPVFETEVLQARLRRIDDALDRMMSGASLDRHTDSDVILESLNAFDNDKVFLTSPVKSAEVSGGRYAERATTRV